MAPSATTFASDSYNQINRSLRNHALILLPALLFLVVIVTMNRQLFVTPLVEDGDFAVNTIKVQNAKHFHELLGNSSRWHFHHPGPFFFYLWGVGEAILYDAAPVVPAPLNAEMLTELVFSTACLFLAIYVFYVNVRRPLFPGMAVLVSLLFLWVVTSALPSTAMVSVWPPYMAMPCFVLLAAACASVAAGKWQHIPLLALSAMIMIHAHVAQLLFATALAAAALSSLAFRELKSGTLAENLRIYRYYLAAALGIVALFLLPITLDWASHHANNIHQIRVYLRAHRGEHNSFSQALLYTFSFLTYYVTPEIVLAKPTVTLRDLISPDGFVPVFWSLFLAISTLALITHFRSGRKVPFFLQFMFAEIVLIILLFLYWSWKMTGPMYIFNGYFFFSVQLLALLAFVSLLSYGAGTTLKRHTQIAITCGCAALLLLVTYCCL